MYILTAFSVILDDIGDVTATKASPRGVISLTHHVISALSALVTYASLSQPCNTWKQRYRVTDASLSEQCNTRKQRYREQMPLL